MPYGAHETMEVHEVLNEKINMINHFSLYAKECKNQQLRQMIDHHLQTALQAYDQLVGYTHDYNAQGQRSQTYGMPNVQTQQIQYGLNNPQPQTPQMQGNFNDQQIAQAMLICHKSSAKSHLVGSLECADPHVRQMLLNGANTCANQAYEVFMFMNQQGLYQVPTLQDHTAKTYLHSYQPMNQQGMAQQQMNMHGNQPVHQ